MSIRKAKVADIEQIAKVHIACWRTTYKGIISDDFLENKLSLERSKKNWANSITNFPDSILLVAENESNEIVGFCSGGLNREKEKIPQFEGELMAIYILEKYQKKSIGTKLVKEFVKALQKKNIRNMIIWVLKENESKFFYEKLGGEYITEKTYKIGGEELIVIAYGIKDFKKILAKKIQKELKK